MIYQNESDFEHYSFSEVISAIDRIRRMERIFDALRADPAREDLRRELIAYYEGGQWLRDYELDEQGLLPPGLKRGVLSQDGVYDFLENPSICDN